MRRDQFDFPPRMIGRVIMKRVARDARRPQQRPDALLRVFDPGQRISRARYPDLDFLGMPKRTEMAAMDVPQGNLENGIAKRQHPQFAQQFLARIR